MSEFPCKNKSCKSYGKPHPNCHCYGDMAEGGEAKRYCSTTQAHQKDCQYFAEGGSPADDSLGGPPKAPTWDSTTSVSSENAPKWENTTPEEPTWENTSEPEEPTWKDTTGKYETIPQQIATGIEGAAQGFAGPLATLAEKGLSKLGVPEMADEDIKGRQEANPLIHGLSEAGGLGVGLLTGTGEAALIGKGVSGLAKLAKVGEGIEAVSHIAHIGKLLGVGAKVGSAAIQGALQTGLFQFGDNISKSLVGEGDPNEALAAKLWDGVKGAGLIGAVFGGLGNVASQGLEYAGTKQAGNKIYSFLNGVGHAAKDTHPDPAVAPYLDNKWFERGEKWWKYKTALATSGSGLKAGYDLYKGFEEGDILQGGINAAKDLAIGMGLSAGIGAFSKSAGSILLKAIGNGEMAPNALLKLIDYGNEVNGGAQKMTRAVEGLFKIGGQQLNDKYDFERNRSKLDKYIEDGGINQNIDETMYDQNQSQEPQGYAKGGEVKRDKTPERKVPPIVQDDDPIAKHLPEQNMLMTAAKARISNYLTGLRPKKNQPKLAFDDPPDQMLQKRSYDKALDIANNPMSIMAHISNGTIEPEHLRHFNALYPEISGVLQKKLTEKIIQGQLSGKKPSYAVRQGLSMMLGTPLSGELSPQNIQAAQATFQNKGAPQPGGQTGAPKKSTAKLSKSNQAYLTGNQALIGRQQRQS